MNPATALSEVQGTCGCLFGAFQNTASLGSREPFDTALSPQEAPICFLRPSVNTTLS